MAIPYNTKPDPAHDLRIRVHTTPHHAALPTFHVEKTTFVSIAINGCTENEQWTSFICELVSSERAQKSSGLLHNELIGC
jgi:hypothetical protein